MPSKFVRVLALLLGAGILVALTVSCTRSTAWRTEPPANCRQTCAESYIEEHDNFELSFIEFSERGNQFDRRKTEDIVSRIESYASEDSGVAVVVFVHGWLHNASNDDRNVKSFRQVLNKIGSANILGERKLMGVYIGWRGKSLYGAGSEYLTYWARKSVAEEIGANGVSSVILKLAEIDARKPDNILLIAGHSFGGAMTLSAVDNILLTKMITGMSNGKATPPIGEGVVLLNPAIEANQIFALKEHSMRFAEQSSPQSELLHVISSKGDQATHVYFPVGQSIAALGWEEVDFERYYQDKLYKFSEHNLDITTIGNYERFWTGAITLNRNNRRDPYDQPLGEWKFHDYCEDKSATTHNPLTARLPCSAQDPIVFLSTDASFIKDHGDIFNDKVSAYLTSIVASSLHQESKMLSENCERGGHFSFAACFGFFMGQFNDLNAEE
ncbi:alpha/beta hydrolase [Gilvimarinus sp. SDUM040013]|uniref:Alpha/beta hydrolase n=1 Tax=Gilvimarinus gilvus TaxID=3058038 RepID=A0ABU4RV81_9GAMM|nr:alpha/beta hydrolase [Gilvimarinus sp. SDUM040013]MDO3387034.1 alpha/beta hydrolase [Gilvimarinus sp. SDUM040013]MDX6848072.1 alpha/beta hydrolase [Gilvimarinus sp. SDUM040013]